MHLTEYQQGILISEKTWLLCSDILVQVFFAFSCIYAFNVLCTGTVLFYCAEYKLSGHSSFPEAGVDTIISSVVSQFC